MLSYAHGTGDLPLLAETIGANLERTSARFPHATALVSCHQNVRLSYAELNAAIDALADGLRRAGLQRGDRVGVWSPNRVEWTLVQYATAKLGIILVNVNPSYRTSELQYALARSGCRWLFAASEFRETEVDRVCIPVPLYHCFGMVIGNLCATSHGAAWSIPRRHSSRPSRSRPVRRRAARVSTAFRRCSSRCSSIPASASSTWARCAPA
jgi:acyl-CoA synthetase (AMP-forming)/AMP-acid ligase II